MSKSYPFTYDVLGRLLSAVYSGSGSNRNETITGYDLKGNIQGIIRDGWDTVSMSYSGNRLTSVGGSTCGYDADGRLISDARKGITSITYTSSGFPQKITFSDGSTIMYAYTADGARLRSKHSGGGITRDWCGEAVYEGGVRKMIMHEEGYIDCTASNAMGFYVKDHLGSVRAVLNSSGTVMESTDYYPLGGQFNTSSSQVQPYKFSGKELDTYKNINTLDFGARTYDPSIGRWLTQDPMAEKYYSMTPYNYCAGNPVRYVDLFELYTSTLNEYTKKEQAKREILFTQGTEVTELDRTGYLGEDGNYVLPAAVCFSRNKQDEDFDKSLDLIQLYRQGVQSITSYGLERIATRFYDEKNNIWRGANGKTYSMSINGNKYTGGKIKYAKAFYDKFHNFGVTISAIGLVESSMNLFNSDTPEERSYYVVDILLTAASFAVPEVAFLSIAWSIAGSKIVEKLYD